MKSLLLSILTLAFIGAGCSRKESASPPRSEISTNDDNATSAAPAVEPQPNDPTPAPAPPSRAVRRAEASAAAANSANQSFVGMVDPFMTGQLKRFIEEKGRLPKDFAEFAAARMDSVPRPPEGLKYAIDPTTQEIKLVRR
jgi:hypothetical protein